MEAQQEAVALEEPPDALALRAPRALPCPPPVAEGAALTLGEPVPLPEWEGEGVPVPGRGEGVAQAEAEGDADAEVDVESVADESSEAELRKLLPDAKLNDAAPAAPSL